MACEVTGYDRERVTTQVDAIHDTILQIAERAKAGESPTHRVADTMAQEKLRQASR